MTYDIYDFSDYPDIDSDIVKALEGASDVAQKFGSLLNLTSDNIARTAYATKVRVKGHASLRKKVANKRKQREKGSGPKGLYCPFDATDIVGARIVTLFEDDKIEACKDLLYFVGIFCVNDIDLFEREPIKEIIVYHNGSKEDINASERIDQHSRSYFRERGWNYDNVFKQEYKDTKYSSIHLVLYANLVQEGGFGSPSKRVSVPIEIQIRTGFEDVWGEIEHRFNYKYESRGLVGYEQGRYETAKEQIKLIKSQLNSASEAADSFKKVIDGISGSVKQAVIGKNFSDVIPFIQTLRGILDNEIINEAMYLSEEQNKIASLSLESQSLVERDADNKIYKLGELSDRWLSLLENSITSLEESGQKEQVVYHFSMERAFCLLQIHLALNVHTPSKVRDAIRALKKDGNLSQVLKIRASDINAPVDLVHVPISIYEKFSKSDNFKENAIVHFRYAQALAELQEYSAALLTAEEAYGILKKNRNEQPYDWLRVFIPRTIGFFHWHIAYDMKNKGESFGISDFRPKERKRHYHSAIDWSKQSLIAARETSWESEPERRWQESLTINNILYYYCELLRLGVRFEELSIDRACFTSYIDFLMNYVDNTERLNLLNILDTLREAGLLVKRPDVVRKACERIILLFKEWQVQEESLDTFYGEILADARLGLKRSAAREE